MRSVFSLILFVFATATLLSSAATPTTMSAALAATDSLLSDSPEILNDSRRADDFADVKKAAERSDSIVKNKWWKELKRGHVDFNDTTLHYPKTVRFGRAVYKWVDHAFNYYDTSYVKSSGKNFKFMIKTDSWVDSYVGKSLDDIPVTLLGNFTSNAGLQLSFMAVSLGYTVDVNNPFNESSSRKFDFSFTCARFAANAYLIKNDGPVTLSRFGRFIDGEKYSDLKGINREMYGFNAFYFFNHSRYAQAAVYCFSKIQRKSAGSLLLGFDVGVLELDIDLHELPAEVLIRIPAGLLISNREYRSFCLIAGYGHNWVLPRNWVLNVTATPYLGLTRTYDWFDEKYTSLFSLNAKLRVGAVHNRGNFFFGLHSYIDIRRYRSHGVSFYNWVGDFQAIAGVRF